MFFKGDLMPYSEILIVKIPGKNIDFKKYMLH